MLVLSALGYDTCMKVLLTCSKFLFAIVVLCITKVSLFFTTGFILLIGIFGLEVRMLVVPMFCPDCSSFKSFKAFLLDALNEEILGWM